MIRVRMLKTAAGPGGSFEPNSTPELDEDTALAFIEAGAAETYTPARKKQAVETPAAQLTDDELIARFEREARLAGYSEVGVNAIARARLLALRADIPYEEASRRLEAERRTEEIRSEAATRAAAELASDAPEAKPATPEDPEELERQRMFDELVAGGADPLEARALVWPPVKPDGDVERAVRTPPKTATAPAQRPPRRR